MFTGIIVEMGRLRRRAVRPSGARLAIETAAFGDALAPGASIAVNGVCLTVVECAEGIFTADLSEETLRRTTLGRLAIGSLVNLELPLAVGGRLGGHIVQGHVDGTARLVQKIGSTNGQVHRYSLPEELRRYVVRKGSIAVDGVSLTVADLGEEWFTVALVPETLRRTTLGRLDVGDEVNLEADILAKYVEQLLMMRATTSEPAGLTVEWLRNLGY